MTAIKAGAPIGEAKKLLAVKRVTSNKGKKTPPALTAFYGKAPEPNGGLHAACADVDTLKTDLRSPGKPFANMAGSCTSRHQKRESSPSF